MTKAIVPSEVFLSSVSRNPLTYDPWQLEHTGSLRPYSKGEGTTETIGAFRVPTYMHTAMKELVQQGLLPGIKSFADFQLDAFAYYLQRIYDLGIPGMSGFKMEYENEERKQHSVSNERLLESNADTIDVLTKDKNIRGMREMLTSMLSLRDIMVNEPQPFLDKLDLQIERLESLLTPLRIAE